MRKVRRGRRTGFISARRAHLDQTRLPSAPPVSASRPPAPPKPRQCAAATCWALARPLSSSSCSSAASCSTGSPTRRRRRRARAIPSLPLRRRSPTGSRRPRHSITCHHVDFSAVSGPPARLTGAALTGTGGKPQVLYIGAEYCPYCAITRWPLDGRAQPLRNFQRPEDHEVGSERHCRPEHADLVVPRVELQERLRRLRAAVEAEDGLQQPLETPDRRAVEVVAHARQGRASLHRLRRQMAAEGLGERPRPSCRG